MKSRLIAGITVLLAFAPGALAYSVSCSSADQTLSYSYYQSDGGAPMMRSALSYKGQTEERYNSNGPAFDLKISREKDLDKRVDGQTTTTTSTEFAEGSVGSGAQLQKFADYVICKEVHPPVCHLCP